jgi:hypothetical protein
LGGKYTYVWDWPAGGSLDLGNCGPCGAGAGPRFQLHGYEHEHGLYADGRHARNASVGYQSGATEDTCPDLPYPGPTVDTLTAASKELRDLTAEVRIVRGAEADPAAAAHLDSDTLAYLPPKNYPTGVVTLPANFDKPGKYAVLVTVSDGKDMTMSGKLTVTVGQETRRWVLVFAGIILVVGFGIYIWDYNSSKKAVGQERLRHHPARRLV